MTTIVALVTDRTPASLEYDDYRGYVEIDDETGEWLRNVSAEERRVMDLGKAEHNEDYDDARPVLLASDLFSS